MAPRKRTQSATKLLGAANSETRAELIEAVEALLLEEGYAAVTSRKVAGKLGMKHQVVFYYFDTLDDLLLAVFRKTAEEGLARLAQGLQSDEPLRALWRQTSDPRLTRWIMEFMALANHNPAIRAEIAHYSRRNRELQAEVIGRHLQARGVEPRISPMLAAFLMTAIGRLLVNDASLDIDLAHEDAEALIEDCLRRFETTGEAAGPLLEKT
jgi:AcrR family transcriptional regulator